MGKRALTLILEPLELMNLWTMLTAVLFLAWAPEAASLDTRIKDVELKQAPGRSLPFGSQLEISARAAPNSLSRPSSLSSPFSFNRFSSPSLLSTPPLRITCHSWYICRAELTQ